jgi:hypothetical protein
MNYTITLTFAENLALAYIAGSQQEWIENVVRERCRIAIDEIVTIAVQKCLETNTQIPSSKDDIVKLAFDMGWVLSGEERNNQLTPLIV